MRPGADDRLDVDAYILDTLMPDLVGHDRTPSAFIVYLHLWRESAGRDVAHVTISLRQIAERTGLSKRGVQEALSVLARRRLVRISRGSITDVPTYAVERPWIRSARGRRT